MEVSFMFHATAGVGVGVGTAVLPAFHGKSSRS